MKRDFQNLRFHQVVHSITGMYYVLRNVCLYVIEKDVYEICIERGEEVNKSGGGAYTFLFIHGCVAKHLLE